MRDSFGARLRRHREQRHVSLADIAEQTKIKASLLEGLERDDISLWPSGIFRRAYVRSYAMAIGFDADAAVREFLTLYPDPAEAAEPAPPPPGGLRGLFGSFRRRSPVSTPQPTQPAVPEVAAAPLPTQTDAAPPPEISLAQAAPEPVNPPPQVVAETEPKTEQKSDSRPHGHARRPRPVDAAPRPQEGGLRTADLLAAASVCTELGRVELAEQILPLLGDAAKVLRARGLIVWVWDSGSDELKPALVHGYSAKVRARLRGVSPTADNLTAAAYRAGAPLARSGALAVPLLIPSACAGVLAIEVENDREQDAEMRALATCFAAMLAQLVASPTVDTRDGDTAPVRAVAVQPG